MARESTRSEVGAVGIGHSPRSLLLTIDTSGARASVALGEIGKAQILADVEGGGERSHSEDLTRLVREVLQRSNSSVDHIGTLVLGAGPGSFTGLRIGFAFAQGLALGQGLTVIVVPSPLGLGATYVVSSAGRGVVFLSKVTRADSKSANAASVDSIHSSLAELVCVSSLEEVSVAQTLLTEAMNAGETVCALSPVADFPALELGAGVARRLTELYLSSSESERTRLPRFVGARELSSMVPNYVRDVAARSLAERESSARTKGAAIT